MSERESRPACDAESLCGRISFPFHEVATQAYLLTGEDVGVPLTSKAWAVLAPNQNPQCGLGVAHIPTEGHLHSRWSAVNTGALAKGCPMQV